ncbi:MAG TPA: hypothetical protein VFR85_20595 [Anaeromyxobacteraceae bacterium]|nr:hypothetical protein [Anaeromyxobacteraceae bacterium]
MSATGGARVAGWRTLLLAAAIAGATAAPAWPTPARAEAQAAAKEEWRKEFEEVCARTQDAMALPSDELRSLVARCDKLKPVVEQLDESQRKVFSKRLRDCRAVYQFVLDSREAG